MRTCTTSLYLSDARIELTIRDIGVLSMVEKGCSKWYREEYSVEDKRYNEVLRT